jgi:translation elongation factor EF-1beta
MMKTYSVLSASSMWSTKKLKEKVENLLNEKTREGYEIVSVAFGVDMWWIPTAYITVAK